MIRPDFRQIQTSNDLLHYGVKRKSGRYPWGSGDRPYQSEEEQKVRKISMSNGGTHYSIRDHSGKIISELRLYDFSMKDFDWDLIADVETDPSYRGRGLATSVINLAYKDTKKKNKGLYLFVKQNNQTAIKLYKKLNFDTIQSYKLDDEKYFIMAKGPADKKQFNGMNFS